MDRNAVQEDWERLEEGLDAKSKRLPEIALSVPAHSLPLRKPVTIAASATVAQAVDAMLAGNTGYAVVVEDGKLVGIVTERDILMRVAPEFRDIERRSVTEIMSHEPKFLRWGETLAAALRVMHVGHLRHLPLVDEDGAVREVISVRDIVDYIVEHFPAEVLNLPPEPVRRATQSREGA